MTPFLVRWQLSLMPLELMMLEMRKHWCKDASTHKTSEVLLLDLENLKVVRFHPRYYW